MVIIIIIIIMVMVMIRHCHCYFRHQPDYCAHHQHYGHRHQRPNRHTPYHPRSPSASASTASVRLADFTCKCRSTAKMRNTQTKTSMCQHVAMMCQGVLSLGR